MKYYTWATMIVVVSVASILLWNYLEARDPQLRRSAHSTPVPVQYTPFPAGKQVLLKDYKAGNSSARLSLPIP